MHFTYFLHCDSAIVTPSNDGVCLVTTNKIASLTRWTPSCDGVTKGGEDNCKGRVARGEVTRGENNREADDNVNRLHCDSAFVTPSNDGVCLVTTNKIASLTRWTPSCDGVTMGGRIIVKGE
jgi:hypothetical protein